MKRRRVKGKLTNPGSPKKMTVKLVLCVCMYSVCTANMTVLSTLCCYDVYQWIGCDHIRNSIYFI